MSWGAIVVLAPVMVLSGLAVAALGRRAQTGRLRRNAVAGIRTRETMKSDEAWAAGHAAGGGLMIVAGGVLVIAGLVLLVRPSNLGGSIVTLASTGLVLVVSVASARRANRAAREVD